MNQPAPDSNRIYKVVSQEVWKEAERQGFFAGSGIDLTDGFIHLSSREQVRETVAKYFAGASDLVLITVDADKLADTLRWEPSRDGAMFPHVYGPIPMSAVLGVAGLSLGPNDEHQFPASF